MRSKSNTIKSPASLVLIGVRSDHLELRFAGSPSCGSCRICAPILSQKKLNRRLSNVTLLSAKLKKSLEEINKMIHGAQGDSARSGIPISWPKPTNIKMSISTSKTMIHVFFNSKGVFHKDCQRFLLCGCAGKIPLATTLYKFASSWSNTRCQCQFTPHMVLTSPQQISFCSLRLSQL